MFTGAFLREFLIGVGTVTGIAALLAVVMAIADATIGNYGTVKVSINDGARELSVDGGRPLLSTLMGEGIFIPSACGGKGSCGLCKLQVTDGAGSTPPSSGPGSPRPSAGGRCACPARSR